MKRGNDPERSKIDELENEHKNRTMFPENGCANFELGCYFISTELNLVGHFLSAYCTAGLMYWPKVPFYFSNV